MFYRVAAGTLSVCLRSKLWREWQDSNLLLSGLESGALPVVLHSRGGAPQRTPCALSVSFWKGDSFAQRLGCPIKNLVGLGRFELPKATVFETAGCARFAYATGPKTLVVPEGVEPSRPKALVSKTSTSANSARGPWWMLKDSNLRRRRPSFGLQPKAIAARRSIH